MYKRPCLTQFPFGVLTNLLSLSQIPSWALAILLTRGLATLTRALARLFLLGMINVWKFAKFKIYNLMQVHMVISTPVLLIWFIAAASCVLLLLFLLVVWVSHYVWLMISILDPFIESTWIQDFVKTLLNVFFHYLCRTILMTCYFTASHLDSALRKCFVIALTYLWASTVHARAIWCDSIHVITLLLL